MDDANQLLRLYAETGSEQAFRELVRQNLQMVNATALRLVAYDAHLAQDVAQLVFTDLARKAKSLPESVVLGGWLHRHTCFTAAKTVRAECRRRARERTAMEIHAVNDNAGVDAVWAQMAPVLDEALNRLRSSDRDLVVLRYLQRRDVRSIGAAVGVSENAVQKRLGRALEKLRGILTRHGVTLSTALLASTLDVSASTPVPSGLAATISTSAITAAAATGTGLTLTTLTYMTLSKFVAGAAALFAVAGVTIAIIGHNSSSAQLDVPNPTTKAASAVTLSANKISADAPAVTSASAPSSPATPSPATNSPSTASATPSPTTTDPANPSTSTAVNSTTPPATTAQGNITNPATTVGQSLPAKINVVGAVAKPGWVTIPPGEKMTVKGVLTAAGGPTRRASRYVTISRLLPSGQSESIKNFDARAAWEDPSKDTELRDGDSILVGESMLGDSWPDTVADSPAPAPNPPVAAARPAGPSINILGAVNRPGPVQFSAGEKMTVVSAIAGAGGPTSKASRYARITHKKPDGATETITKFDLRAAFEDPKKDIELASGDTVHMGESILGDSWF